MTAHREAILHVPHGHAYRGHLLRLERAGASEPVGGRVFTGQLERGGIVVYFTVETTANPDEVLLVLDLAAVDGMSVGLWSFHVDADGQPWEDGYAYVSPTGGPPADVDVSVLDVVDLTVVELVEVADGGEEVPSAPLLVAAHVLSGHRVITTDDDGRATYADVDNPAHARGPFWLTTSSVGDGASFRPLEAGDELVEAGWSWPPRAKLFLGADGQLTATPPAGSFVVMVGVALEATRIVFDPAPSVLT